MGTAQIILKSGLGQDVERRFMNTLFPSLKRKGLPDYAIPRLVTISQDLELNATFKYVKEALKMKDWRPSDATAAKDRVASSDYWLDGQTYKPLDAAAWTGIETGKAKL